MDIYFVIATTQPNTLNTWILAMGLIFQNSSSVLRTLAARPINICTYRGRSRETLWIEALSAILNELVVLMELVVASRRLSCSRCCLRRKFSSEEGLASLVVKSCWVGRWERYVVRTYIPNRKYPFSKNHHPESSNIKTLFIKFMNFSLSRN